MINNFIKTFPWIHNKKEIGPLSFWGMKYIFSKKMMTAMAPEECYRNNMWYLPQK